MTIKVNEEKCIKCGRCIKVCPQCLFEIKDNKVQVPTYDRCIECGHCVAACPVGAVEHSDFPEFKVHKVDNSLLPTDEQLMMLINARRSNRTFTKEPVPMDKLVKIVEAAHRAPTGSNSQDVGFVVITNKEKLQKISLFAINVMEKAAKKLNNPVIKLFAKPFFKDAYRYVPVFLKMRGELEKGNDLILRGATAVILFVAPNKSRMGAIDCNLAYQNGSLMAESLGVSQLYTGFVLMANKRTKQELEKILGIEGKEICAGMALGIPEFKFPNYIDKKEAQIQMML